MPSRTRSQATPEPEPGISTDDSVARRREQGGERKTITGNLVRVDEPLTIGEDGTPRTRFSVAVDRRRQQDGQWKTTGTDYYRVIAFGRLAENFAESDTKPGSRLKVDGFFKDPEIYDREDGSKGVRQNEVNASDISASMLFAKVDITKTASRDGRLESVPIAGGEELNVG